MFERARARGFVIVPIHHAEAILTHDMSLAVEELEAVLLQISIPVEELVRGGGGEAPHTQRMRRALADYGWDKHRFEVKKTVDGVETESVSHEIDHVRRFPLGTFALEIEWNNKDPFFDRDLENFKRLHSDGAISIGGIVTRGESLQDGLRELVESFALLKEIDSLDRVREYYKPTERQIVNINKAIRSRESFEQGWAHAFVSDKFGESTTHWRKLVDRIDRGVGNPCPLLLIGIPRDIVSVG